MTRDEEIYNAINNLQIGVYDEDISSDNDEYNNDEYDGSDIQNAFYAGAKWADENPKSPWISVKDDLPCNHNDLISTECDKETVYVVVIGKDVIADTDCMEYNGKEWVWQKNSFFEPTHWFPIPKLPK